MPLRSKESSTAYKLHQKSCGGYSDFTFCNIDSLKEWNYWRLVDCKFLYDLIADDHKMVVPKRIFSRLSEATPEEFAELEDIKTELANDYHTYLESAPNETRSVVTHYHLHCIKLK